MQLLLGAAVQGVRFVFPEEQGQKPSGSALPVPFPHAPVIAPVSYTHLTIAQVKDALPLRPLQEGDLIRVSLPLSEDHSVLRPAQDVYKRQAPIR